MCVPSPLTLRLLVCTQVMISECCDGAQLRDRAPCERGVSFPSLSPSAPLPTHALSLDNKQTNL